MIPKGKKYKEKFYSAIFTAFEKRITRWQCEDSWLSIMLLAIFKNHYSNSVDLNKISKIPEVTATSQKYPQDND